MLARVPACEIPTHLGPTLDTWQNVIQAQGGTALKVREERSQGS